MCENKRTARNKRETGETRVQVSVCIDGNGRSDIRTGIGFLDHMLTLLARHARMDLDVHAEGDLDVDDHHTSEDVGIVLGLALRDALGDKAGINRFADVAAPMQDSLVSVALDICGRPYLAYDVAFPTEKIGAFDVHLVEEFLHALVCNAGVTLHVRALSGSNSHHIAEAVFKALALALRRAAARDPHLGDDIPSTKGTL